METLLICYRCSKKLELKAQDKISLREECPHCAADLHCCKMCIFFDQAHYNQCREPNAERIVDKEKANYCDYFALGSSKDNSAKEDHLKLANSLFKK